MSLNRALVDRARRVYTREDPSTPWREGSPDAVRAYGPWVRVRFRRQVESEAGNGVQVNEEGALLIGLKDERGVPTYVAGRFIAWDADDMVQIRSAEGEDELWSVSSGVRPLRRRKGFVGFRCTIRAAREATVAEGPLIEPPHLAQAPRAETGPMPVVDPEWAYEGG